MPDYGPVGGPGGYEFDEVAPAGMDIGALIVRYGGNRNVITGIQAVYRSQNGAIQFGEIHGSFEVPGTRQAQISLREGEFIVEIQGTYGQFLDSLQVETSEGQRTDAFGGHATNSYEFPDRREPRQEIFGFFGRGAQLIDAFGVHARPR
jgi:hypothetical protein